MSDEAINDELVAEEVEADQYLVFTVQSREFGFQAMRVQEISTVSAATPVPNAPSYIEGIMNLRGRIASVINFRRKFGFEVKEHDEDTRVIVVELGSYPIGIIVDSVEEVIKIPDESVQQLPESTTTAESKEYMTGVGMLDKRMIILLDMDKVLTGTELFEVDEINKAIDEAKAAETLEQAADEANAAEVPEQATDEAQTTETPEEIEDSEPDIAQPVNAGKRQRKGGTG